VARADHTVPGAARVSGVACRSQNPICHANQQLAAHTEQLHWEHARLSKSMDQDGLMSLEQLHCRMPELRKQDQTIQAEIAVAGNGRSRSPSICNSSRRREISRVVWGLRDTLDMPERQKILRLLVKEVPVGRE
jgi:site-specific DNA recombinase